MLITDTAVEYVAAIRVVIVSDEKITGEAAVLKDAPHGIRHLCQHPGVLTQQNLLNLFR
jgi:hypothetical protein